MLEEVSGLEVVEMSTSVEDGMLSTNVEVINELVVGSKLVVASEVAVVSTLDVVKASSLTSDEIEVTILEVGDVEVA